MTFDQQLAERRLLDPKADEVVPVDWDLKGASARVALKGEARYDVAVRQRQEWGAFKAVAKLRLAFPLNRRNMGVQTPLRAEELRAQFEEWMRKAGGHA
ncbi:MAG TPA: hypothetical protein VG869_15740 [Acidimicrobiia bacterium]|nr:hypothetical protein [Acidimicrobiia bacterium]